MSPHEAASTMQFFRNSAIRVRPAATTGGLLKSAVQEKGNCFPGQPAWRNCSLNRPCHIADATDGSERDSHEALCKWQATSEEPRIPRPESRPYSVCHVAIAPAHCPRGKTGCEGNLVPPSVSICGEELPSFQAHQHILHHLRKQIAIIKQPFAVSPRGSEEVLSDALVRILHLYRLGGGPST